MVTPDDQVSQDASADDGAHGKNKLKYQGQPKGDDDINYKKGECVICGEALR